MNVTDALVNRIRYGIFSFSLSREIFELSLPGDIVPRYLHPRTDHLHPGHYLTIEQLMTTKSWKDKDLSGCTLIGESDVEYEIDFSEFNFRNTVFYNMDLRKCKFFDPVLHDGYNPRRAILSKAVFFNCKLDFHQVSSLDSHGTGYSLIGCFIGMDLSDWDLSKFRQCKFYGCDLTKANFDEAVINDCYFVEYRITPEQIYSTKEL
jgi:uncharacterized protein YjbI with pentapeptide repeats